MKHNDTIKSECDDSKAADVPIIDSQMRTRIRVVADMYASRNAAALAAGCSKQSLDKYMKGEQSPTLKTMHLLTSGVGVSLDWLATGGGQMLKHGANTAVQAAITERAMCHAQTHQESHHNVKYTQGSQVDLAEFALIPRYADQASHTDDADTQDFSNPLFSIAFRRYWIQHYLRANPADLAVISVKGDSMDGVLNDRDVILVDLADATPTGGLYVVRQGADLLVKRVQKLTGSRLLLLSANPAYVPVEVDPARDEDFAVIGRVVWFGRQI